MQGLWCFVLKRTITNTGLNPLEGVGTIPLPSRPFRHWFLSALEYVMLFFFNVSLIYEKFPIIFLN